VIESGPLLGQHAGMTPRDYLDRVKLQVSERAVHEAQTRLWGVLEETRKASIPATPHALSRLYSFKVPKLSDDGTCSLVDELAPQPYDLADALGGRNMRNTLSLMVLSGFLEAAVEGTRVDWLGLYQARPRPTGQALVKLSARGAPSRAEFPLTADFERRSTNVTVARSGSPSVIADVQVHAKAGGAYYECDPKVRSEACLPLFGSDGGVVGVVDAEHSSPGAFDDARLGWLVALACEVPSHLPPVK
jgi:putative methionine-R-sulfoxide reductase with GAF domain